VGSGLTLTLNGVGISNNSGTTQNFVAAPSVAPNAIRLFFKNSATAGSGTFFIMNGGATLDGSPGWILFDDSSSASNGTFMNKGPIVGAAGNGFNSGSGMTRFFDISTADNATFTNDAATVSGSGGGLTEFHDASTAGNGIFTNKGATVSGAGGGFTYF